jgi:hypothetical protein
VQAELAVGIFEVVAAEAVDYAGVWPFFRCHCDNLSFIHLFLGQKNKPLRVPEMKSGTRKG